MVLIGIDPHKSTHTAVAVDKDENTLGELTVRADRLQVERLLKWAIDYPDRLWAIESATGLGHLLAQQLICRRSRRRGRPSDPRSSSQGPGVNQVPKKRPERRTFDGHRSPACSETENRGTRGSWIDPADARGSPPRPRRASHLGHLSPPRPDSGLSPWWDRHSTVSGPGRCGGEDTATNDPRRRRAKAPRSRVDR
jgi:hypothetical protein